MKHIFYLMAIAPIIFEMKVLYSPVKTHRFLKDFKGVTDKSKYTNTQLALTFFSLCYMLWSFIGLFSSQWIVFLGLILLSVIPKPHPALKFIDALISIVILLFIILNAYHLHIDTFQLFINLFK